MRLRLPLIASFNLAGLRWGIMPIVAFAMLIAAVGDHEAEAAQVNAGFESGDLTGWITGTVTTEGVSVVGTDTIAPGLTQAPLEGSFMARLGEPQPSAFQPQPLGQNELFQNFTITETNVQFAYNIWTYDYTGFDRFSVELKLTGSGAVIYSYSQQAWGAPFDTTRKNTGWQVVDIPTSQYVGQQARLTFSAGGSIDNLYAFWAYIDSAESTIPPQVVDFSGITVNGFHPSRDPASKTIHVTRPPGTGFFDIVVPVDCPDGSDPNSVTLIVGTPSPLQISLTNESGNEWSGRVNTPQGTSGQSFPLTLVIDCDGQLITIYIGSLTLIDPSGFITDADTDLPIPEATVTLQRLVGGEWENVNPYATNQDGSPQIAPKVNPQKTDADGHYGWDVIAGTYRVVVLATNYIGQTSPQVTVPPPVTDLDLELQPLEQLIQGDVDCNAVVNAVDALKILRETAGFDPAPCALTAGDVNCSGGNSSVDALFILRHVASLPVNQPQDCTDIGDPLPE